MRHALACGVVLVLLGSCLPKIPEQRLPTETPISVAIVVDGPENDVKVPGAFLQSLDDVLKKKNLFRRAVDGALLEREKSSQTRFDKLLRANDAPVAMLIELRPSFFAQINGRFRWTVVMNVTVSRDRLAPHLDKTEIPAILLFEHERESEAIEAVADFASQRISPLLDAALADQALPAELDGGVSSASAPLMYFVMIDRFANGSPTNDATIDLSDPAAFHGGDIKGLTDRLPWLQSLGVTTIWLSPLFKMRTEKWHGFGAFHGYWVESLDELEPRFGTMEELKTLKARAADLGISLVLDVVVNHVAPESKLVAQHPDWFHRNGGVTDWNDQTQLETFDVHGLPDLAVERPQVHERLRASAFKWVDALHPAGFRLDAVKHVPVSFWSTFNQEVSAHANDPQFEQIGELLGGAPETIASVWKDGHFTSMFDFPLRNALVNIICHGASTVQLASTLSNDRAYPDASRLITLLDNHDLPRLATECDNDQKKISDALTLLFSLRGTPSLAWGTEVGLTGDTEPANRADMQFNAGHPLVKHLSQLSAQRAAHPSLRDGKIVLLSTSRQATSLLSIHDAETALIVVATVRTPIIWHGVSRETFADLPAEVPAGVTIRFAPTTAALRASRTGPATQRSVNFERVSTFDRLVGSAPELGSWDPQRSISLPATLSFPDNIAIEWKRIALTDAGVSWEPGENHVTLLSSSSLL